MKKVYNAEPYGYSEQAKNKWIKKGYSYQEGSWDEIESAASIDGVDVLIVRLQKKVTEDVLRKFPKLRFLISATTGHDHIDEEAIKKLNIQLHSLRGHDDFLKTIPSTAEHTWALIMSLLRNIPQAHNDTLVGNWNRDAFRGFQLQNKTIGIIGMGRTGAKVAEFAKVFGMEIQFYDPNVSDPPIGRKRTSITELVNTSDIISIHVHLTHETKHLVDRKLLAHAKEGAYLINTSRGKIWNEEDVVEFLTKKVLKGVATDVLYGELKAIDQSPLWQYAQSGNNVIITPHIGGATWDAMWACEEFMVDEKQ